MSEVVVVDYDPEWPAIFEQLRTEIWPAVSELAISIEHVGSTSVPGLAAKPVVDLDVVVPPGRVPEGIARLEALGYEHRGDLGIPGREALRRPPDAPRHHLYLCPADSPALANHLAIRDHLRANPPVAERYGALKNDLARRFPNDIDAYIEGKTDFLVAILREVGFAEDVVSDIERRNRSE